MRRSPLCHPVLASLCLLTLSGLGCATAPARPADGSPPLTGPAYALREQGPALVGEVCGSGVSLRVAAPGAALRLEGTVARQDAEVRIDPLPPVVQPAQALDDGEPLTTVQPEGRRFTGYLGAKNFDLTLQPERLTGRLGTLVLDLQRQGDQLIAVAADDQGRVLALRGAEALWTMAPPAQGAVLPALLACLEQRYPSGPVIAAARFGGPTEPPQGPPLTLDSAVPRGQW